MQQIVLVSALIIALMIAAPSVHNALANQADTEQEAGIASDKMGRACLD